MGDKVISWSGLRCLYTISRDLTLAAIASYLLFKAYKRLYLDKYYLVGKVADLRIYPVVSCGAIQVSNAQCSPTEGLCAYGIQDKALAVCKKNEYPHPMLAYGEYRQISLREKIKIDVEFTPENITLIEPEGTSVSFTPPTVIESYPDKRPFQLVCVKNIYAGYKVDDYRLRKWFDKCLSQPKSGNIEVMHRTKLLWDKSEGRTVLGRLVVMNGESVISLFREDPDSIGHKMDMCYEQFCPNIVISGCRPYTEKKWKKIAIGSQVVGDIIGPDLNIIEDGHANIYDPDFGMTCLDTGEAVEEYPDVKFMCGMNGSRPIGVSVKVMTAGEIAVGDPVFAVYERPPTLTACLLELYDHWLHSKRKRATKGRTSLAKSFSFRSRSGRSFGMPVSSRFKIQSH